jgi:hypothetical protein
MPKESSSAHIAGVIQTTSSRKTTQQVPVVATQISIQSDGALEPKRKEASDATKAAAAQKIEPSSVRLTGEIQVAPSARSGRVTTRMEGASSFQIDPSLTAEAGVASEAPPVRPSDNQPAVASSGKRHQSGNFSPIEKDFFAREADLYKDEAVESFTDLEEKRAKQAAKDRNGGKNGKNDKRPRK